MRQIIFIALMILIVLLTACQPAGLAEQNRTYNQAQDTVNSGLGINDTFTNTGEAIPPSFPAIGT